MEKKTRIQLVNKRKIMEAAVELFGRHGLRGTTLDQIAKRAGLSKPNLLYYYSSKKQLYKNALSNILDMWLTPLESLDPEGEPRKELGLYIDRKMKMSRDFPDASKMYALEVMNGGENIASLIEERLRQTAVNGKKVLSYWMRTGRLRKVDPMQLMFMIWATTQHYADFKFQVESLTGKTLDEPAYYRKARRTVKDIIFGGVLSEVD